MSVNLEATLAEIRACRLCAAHIPEPRPVLRAQQSSRLLIIGQAPGTRVHASGIPWDDASGKRLRNWLQLDPEEFYDESRVAIIPMGFCYPGKGKSGDLPPRPECARTWHARLLSQLPGVQCTLLIGMYAQAHYAAPGFRNLTDRVANWREFAPEKFVLPHPSPRNQLWLQRNPWFESELVPQMRSHVRAILDAP